jgi:hypothetical protein
MEAVAAVFRSREDAGRAANELHHVRFDGNRVNLLTPESSEAQIHGVKTSETEQPGLGATFGGVIGGTLGLVSGFEFGIAATALIPGVGPVLGIGAAVAALFGIGGAVGGSAVGSAVETRTTEGLPADEVFFYEDALRHGRSVVIAMAQDSEDAEWARNFFVGAGAETVDAARQAWWIGLRDAEAEHYRALGENFDEHEEEYRIGFVAALRWDLRGKSYVAAMDYLKDSYPKIWQSEAFRTGFARGQIYLQDRQHGPQPH